MFLVLICSIISGIIIPKILLVAFRKQLFDVPDERKIHRGAVPRLGGMAFLPVILFSCSLIWGADLSLGVPLELDNEQFLFRKSSFSLCAFMVLYVVGIGDDLIGVRYRAKFLFQGMAALLVVASGMTINNLHGLFGVYELNPVMSVAITMFAIVFIVNSINMIDGIDGLASGLAIAASFGYGIMAIRVTDMYSAFLSFAMVGTLIPFFYYNVFSEQSKKIFMGDTGSLFIGLLLSILGIRFSSMDIDPISPSANVFVVAFTPLIIPCFDVIRVMVHRIRTGRSPFLADKTHIHHKMIDAGLGKKPTMMVIVASSVVLSYVNIFISQYIDVTLVFVLNVILGFSISIMLARISNQKKLKQ